MTFQHQITHLNVLSDNKLKSNSYKTLGYIFICFQKKNPYIAGTGID